MKSLLTISTPAQNECFSHEVRLMQAICETHEPAAGLRVAALLIVLADRVVFAGGRRALVAPGRTPRQRLAIG